ncbi:MAG: Stk1 family PASTA domain-containing Ser/Thr kinase [Firmicutes bacterium]|nr:Stk1 family PASTA domain-containing Ser/Thr kinase [Bacillota bacterium]
MSTRLLAGRYELIQRIGEGGMAVVYKAKDRLLNRFVAVKILKPEFTKDVKVIDSFRRESQAAASLSHPNIVNVYDVGKEGNINYIVMELIEGNVLSDIIKNEGPLEPRRAVAIAKQIAGALSLAHKNQIIHRDVKPHNILITKDGVAKITDFGIAKAMSSSTMTVNQTGTIMGSVHYFSPEQARGGYVDEKSDIYSLGIVMYEMLTGQVPFDADNPVTVAVMHMNEEIVPPSQLNPAISPDVESIVMKATAKYQINRYKTADEMITALSLVNYHPAVTPASSGEETPAKTRVEKVHKGEEEMNKGKKKKKKKVTINKTKLGAIVLAIILAIPASAVAFNLIQGAGEGDEIVVPDLMGMTEEEARQALSAVKLEMELGISLYNKEYDPGEVVSQDPVADSKVKEGHKVTINLNKDKKAGADAVVPSLTGKTVDDAKYSLQAYGFVIGDISTEANELPEGIIINQSPKAGDEAAPGSKVNLVVSKGAEDAEIVMIKLLGMDASEAASEISAMGLKLGETTYGSSSIYDQNQVMAQSIEPGDKVMKGSTVDITISTGLSEGSGEGGIAIGGTTGENDGESGGIKSVAFEISFDAAKNETFFLSVVVSDSNGVSTPIKQRESYKVDESEMISVAGTGQGTIQIIFDNDVVQQLNVNFDTGEVY